MLKQHAGGPLFELEYNQTCRRGVYLSYNVIKRDGGSLFEC